MNCSFPEFSIYFLTMGESGNCGKKSHGNRVKGDYCISLSVPPEMCILNLGVDEFIDCLQKDYKHLEIFCKVHFPL